MVPGLVVVVPVGVLVVGSSVVDVSTGASVSTVLVEPPSASSESSPHATTPSNRSHIFDALAMAARL